MFVVQAILFRNGKAIGRMVTPELRLEWLGASSAAEQRSPAALAGSGPSASPGTDTQLSEALSRHQPNAGAPLQMVQMAFGHWLPAAREKTDSPGSLHIPVDVDFQSSEFRIQVHC